MFFVTLAAFLLFGQTLSTSPVPVTTPTAFVSKPTNPTINPTKSNATDHKKNTASISSFTSVLPSEPSSSFFTTSAVSSLTPSFTVQTSLSTHSIAITDTVQSTTLLPSTNVVLTSELTSTDSLHNMTSIATPASTVVPTPPEVSTTLVVPTTPTASAAPTASITPTTSTTDGINPSSSSSFTTTPSASPTTTSPTPSEQSSNSTNPATTPSTTKVTTATSTVPPTPIKISETNILLNGDAFLEVQGPPNGKVQNRSLVFQDASLPYLSGSATIVPLEGNFNVDGYLLVSNLSNVLKPSSLTWTSVLIVLLDSSNNSTLDVLVYSKNATAKVDRGISERFSIKYNLIADPNNFPSVDITFSRCPSSGSSGEFVLSNSTKNRKNLCDLTHTQNLELKMTSSAPCKLPNNFNNTLAWTIISGVNGKKPCGLSWGMITKFQEDHDCPREKVLGVQVRFTVAAAIQEQLNYVVEGYKSFLSDKNLQLKDSSYTWVMDECTQNCFPSIKPPNNDSDDKIRVTVAVVVSCIGVFLIVLIAVVIYMKSKRNRILQFRMARLDEDEDDLIGDLDDFLGNQAPTFHR